MPPLPTSVASPKTITVDHLSPGIHVFTASLLSDNRLQRRDVTVGIASSTRDEVLSGLAEGDRVAVQGDLALRNGMVVRPRDIP